MDVKQTEVRFRGVKEIINGKRPERQRHVNQKKMGIQVRTTKGNNIKREKYIVLARTMKMKYKYTDQTPMSVGRRTTEKPTKIPKKSRVKIVRQKSDAESCESEKDE